MCSNRTKKIRDSLCWQMDKEIKKKKKARNTEADPMGGNRNVLWELTQDFRQPKTGRASQALLSGNCVEI